MEHPARTLLYEFFLEPIVELLQRIVYGVSEVLMRDDMVQSRSLAARATLRSRSVPATTVPIRKIVSRTTRVEKHQFV